MDPVGKRGPKKIFTDDTHNLTIRLTPAMRKVLARRSHARGVTMAEFVRTMCLYIEEGQLRGIWPDSREGFRPKKAKAYGTEK
jgi:hypothetical protein